MARRETPEESAARKAAAQQFHALRKGQGNGKSFRGKEYLDDFEKTRGKRGKGRLRNRRSWRQVQASNMPFSVSDITMQHQQDLMQFSSQPVILDTNIYTAALEREGACRTIISLAARGMLVVCTTPNINVEFNDIVHKNQPKNLNENWDAVLDVFKNAVDIARGAIMPVKGLMEDIDQGDDRFTDGLSLLRQRDNRGVLLTRDTHLLIHLVRRRPDLAPAILNPVKFLENINS